jgi:hypothetical protein
MISKHVPPLSGLTNLVMATSCTTYGVVGALLLVPISIDMKLWGSYLKSRKMIQYYHDLGFGLVTKAKA